MRGQKDKRNSNRWLLSSALIFTHERTEEDGTEEESAGLSACTRDTIKRHPHGNKYTLFIYYYFCLLFVFR